MNVCYKLSGAQHQAVFQQALFCGFLNAFKCFDLKENNKSFTFMN